MENGERVMLKNNMYNETPKSDKPRMGTIENWRLVDHGSCFIIVGYSVDHPQFAGGIMHTSWLINFDFEKMEVETRNSIYKLGKMA